MTALNQNELRRASRPWGILPSDASAEELSAAVHALAQGLIVGTAALLFETETGPLSQGPLTDREAEVLGLLSRGLANKQIAATLGISEHTVKFHVSSIYTKLNVTNRTEAVREGLRGGWIVLLNITPACRVVTVKSFDELPKLCREEEIKLYGDGDGYAVYATHDGRHVADAEGLTDEWQPDPVYQSGLAYACGYRD